MGRPIADEIMAKTGDNLSYPHCCRIGRCKTGAITSRSWSRFAAEVPCGVFGEAAKIKAMSRVDGYMMYVYIYITYDFTKFT